MYIYIYIYVLYHMNIYADRYTYISYIFIYVYIIHIYIYLWDYQPVGSKARAAIGGSLEGGKDGIKTTKKDLRGGAKSI